MSSVLTNLLFEAQKSGKPVDEAVYAREVGALTAQSWRDEYGLESDDEEDEEDSGQHAGLRSKRALAGLWRSFASR